MVVRQKEQNGMGHILGRSGSLLVDATVWYHLVGHGHFAGLCLIQST
jgi:hypothetical protein